MVLMMSLFKDLWLDNFGLEFTNSIVAAGLNGVWAGDISRLSARSTLPTLWKMEQECHSLFLGLSKKLFSQQQEKPRIATFPNGLSELVQKLGESIETGPSSIRNKTAVQRLEKNQSGWIAHLEDNTSIKTKALVLTLSLIHI